MNLERTQYDYEKQEDIQLAAELVFNDVIPETGDAIDRRIRRLARKDRLIARKSRCDGLWYLSDDTNYLQSPEQGLDDDEALDFLGQKSEVAR
jgi:hypothetical protein